MFNVIFTSVSQLTSDIAKNRLFINNSKLLNYGWMGHTKGQDRSTSQCTKFPIGHRQEWINEFWYIARLHLLDIITHNIRGGNAYTVNVTSLQSISYTKALLLTKKKKYKKYSDSILLTFGQNSYGVYHAETSICIGSISPKFKFTLHEIQKKKNQPIQTLVLISYHNISLDYHLSESQFEKNPSVQ